MSTGWSRGRNKPKAEVQNIVKPTTLTPRPSCAHGLVDCGTASGEGQKFLFGIREAYAKKIIDGRPYTRKDQLVSKKILTKDAYDKISESIIAKAATAGTKAPSATKAPAKEPAKTPGKTKLL